MLRKFTAWYKQRFHAEEIQSVFPFTLFFSILSISSSWTSLRLFLEDSDDLPIFLWSLLPLVIFAGLTYLIYSKTKWFSKLYRFPPPDLQDSSERRKNRYTLILLSVVILLAAFGGFDSFAWWLLGNEWAADGFRLARVAFLAAGVGILVFTLNKKRPGPFARSVFILFLILVFGLTDTAVETTAGRSLIFQIIPVMLAGFIITPIMSIGTAVITIGLLVYRAAQAGIGPNSTAFLAILLIAFISWRIAAWLEDAIRREEEYGHTLQEEVDRRTRQLREANKFKSHFLAQISHELQSPIVAFTLFLRKIRGMSELEEARALEEESIRLLDMTKSISEVSKIELEIMERSLQKKPLDMVEIINKEMFVHSLEAEENNIHLYFEQTDDEYWVLGNRGYLTRVMDNLIKNAIKYTPAGGSIAVSVDRQQGEIVVVVKDSGIGIPREDVPGIFDRFSRASNVGDRTGSGLGLSMVKNMVEAMEGEISVDSVRGQGSAFTVRLPAAEGVPSGAS